jgi:hypothetical protein
VYGNWGRGGGGGGGSDGDRGESTEERGIGKEREQEMRNGTERLYARKPKKKKLTPIDIACSSPVGPESFRP